MKPNKNKAILAIATTMLLLCSCTQTPAPATISTPEPVTSSTAPVEPPAPESIETVVAAPAPRIISQDVFEKVSPVVNGYAMAVKGTDWGYLGADGVFIPTIATDGQGMPVYDGYTPVEHLTTNLLPVSEEGLYPFYHDGKWGVKTMNGHAVVIPAELEYPTIFNNQRAVTIRKVTTSGATNGSGVIRADVASTSQKCAVVDTSGKELFTFEDLGLPHYKNGLLIVRTKDTPDSKLDVIDINGNKIMDINWYSIGGMGSMFGETPYEKEVLNLMSSQEGQLISYVRRDENNQYKDICFVDSTGKTIFTAPAEVSTVNNFYNERIFMRSGNTKLWAMFDNTGKQMTDFKYSNFVSFRIPSYTWVTDEQDKRSTLDRNGNLVEGGEYDSVNSSPQENFLAVGRGGKVGAVDSAGKTIVPMEYEDVTGAYNGFYWGRKDNVYTFYTPEGEPCDFPTTTGVTTLSNTCFAFEVDGGYKVAVVE